MVDKTQVAETQAFRHVKRADRRYRVFMYVVGFGLVIFIGFQLNRIAGNIQAEAKRSIEAVIEHNREVAEEIKASNDRNNRLIICMLLVPPEQRTANTEEDCRKQLPPEPASTQAPSLNNRSNPTNTFNAPRAAQSPSSQSQAPSSPMSPSEHQNPPQNPPNEPQQPPEPEPNLVCLPIVGLCI